MTFKAFRTCLAALLAMGLALPTHDAHAEGSGPWMGLFESVGGSLGICSGSIFYSPGNGPGWRGYSFGLGLGPPGIGTTQTNYAPW